MFMGASNLEENPGRFKRCVCIDFAQVSLFDGARVKFVCPSHGEIEIDRRTKEQLEGEKRDPMNPVWRGANLGEHYIIQCRCGAIIAECKCESDDKKIEMRTGCPKCLPPAHDKFPSRHDDTQLDRKE